MESKITPQRKKSYREIARHLQEKGFTLKSITAFEYNADPVMEMPLPQGPFTEVAGSIKLKDSPERVDEILEYPYFEAYDLQINQVRGPGHILCSEEGLEKTYREAAEKYIQTTLKKLDPRRSLIELLGKKDGLLFIGIAGKRYSRGSKKIHDSAPFGYTYDNVVNSEEVALDK